MDIDLLSKMIRELILDNDSVCLPGLGTFVAEIVPSSFSDRGYTINPPYRRLYFRQTQQNDDSSLADLYAESNKVDKDIAVKILSGFLGELKEVLQQKKTIVFPSLGRLRATKENNFFFVPDEDLDIYPEGFGLEPVSLKTHQETTQEVSAAVSSLEEILRSDAPVPEAAKEEVPEVAEEETPEVEEETPEVEEETPVEEELPEEKEVIEEDSPEEEVVAAVEAVEAEEAPEGEAASEENEAVPEEEVAPEKTGEAPKKIWERWETLEEDHEEARKKEAWPSWLKITLVSLLSIIGLLLLALLVFLLLAQIAPDFIDSILYTPEELRIINY
ncbi:MAG: hypothetical protein II151_05730 [Bacteroidales bacterium]|nr:hypothetical protein [Bacteroidales bacterium]